MQKFDWFCLILIGCLSAVHAGGEWLAADYVQNIENQRRAHHFDRTLIISGEQSARMVARDASAAPTQAPGSGGGQASTQFLSSASLEWLLRRPFVSSVHPWSVQNWEASAASAPPFQVSVYGIDARDVSAFRLGDQNALEDGSLVLSETTRKALRLGSGEVTLSLPSEILAQLPAETAEFARQSGSAILPLSRETLADPPGLKPGKNVAYIHRDADQISGVMKPAALYLVLLVDGADLADAKAEMGAYLDEFERTSSLGVRPVVRAVDEYFPPVVSDAEVRTWLIWLRILLVALYLVAGLGAAWLKLRQHEVEMALRVALGSTPVDAFGVVYGRWLGQLALASLVGFVAVSSVAVFMGQLNHLPVSMGVLLLALLALLLGTLWVARASLEQEPLRTLAGES
jgi:hypothetical protein